MSGWDAASRGAGGRERERRAGEESVSECERVRASASERKTRAGESYMFHSSSMMKMMFHIVSIKNHESGYSTLKGSICFSMTLVTKFPMISTAMKTWTLDSRYARRTCQKRGSSARGEIARNAGRQERGWGSQA